jgi:hypothetical protein
MFTNNLKRVTSKGMAQTLRATGLISKQASFPFSVARTGFRSSVAMRKPMDNFANGTSAVYVDQMYD